MAVTTTATDSYWQFTQTDAYWTAVGVRPPSGTDWDMYMYTPGATVTCTSALLASSLGTSGVDFVIGDFNPGRNATGTYTAGAHMFSGGGTGTIEWDSGADLLQINDPRVDVSTGPGDVLHVWDVYLTAGASYVFSINHPTGTADTRLLLFRNTTGGTYWVGRSSAQFETTGSTSYTAPSDGYYGVVVVNDNGQTGSYGVTVGSCTAPTALTAGTPVSVFTAENWFSFDQQYNYWTGVAVRGTGSNDWDISVNSAASGQSWPVCESGTLATSAGVPPSVDFVVGDFNYNALGSYYVRANLFLQEGSGPATVQWDSGPDQLVLNAPLIKRNLTSSQLIEVWDVFLQTGTLYTLSIDNNGSTGPLMTYVFEPTGGTQWAGPSNAYAGFQTPPGYSVTGISPPVTGWYGIVVVNTQASTGFYGIGMGTCSGAPVNTLARRTPTSGSNQSNFFDIGAGADPLGPYWQAAGVRGDIWQVGAYDPTSPSTGWPYCFSNYFKTSSIGFQTVELAVGDLESCPPAPGALVGINAFQVFAGATAPVSVEWDRADTNLPLGVPINAPIGSGTILRAYRVSLAAGQQYTFTFGSSPVNLGHMYLFHPGGCSPAYWATNADAVLSLSHGSLPYTPATSGDYLVVVTNEVGLSGTYGISVNAGTAAVDEPAERVTRFAAITPNPGRGDAQLEFTLAQPARVAFEVVDLAGRRVATLGDAQYPAGRHALPWEGRSGAASLAPGVYLVRMQVDGRPAGQRKYTVLQ
ncbi:MAG TPA: hypothetical protein VFK69_10895 [Candidatus Eisenbacteria bacterium]|nr:hypothetical protein [Candidatus Eisenbacteria bacterium]